MAPKKRRPVGHGDGGYKQLISKSRRTEGGGVDASSTASAKIYASPAKSQLAEYLLRAVLWGVLSAVVAQKLAILAVEDGARGEGLQEFAIQGSKGTHPEHTWRDLCRRLKTTFIENARFAISLPMEGKGKVTNFDVSMLLPHKVFPILYHKHKDAFINRPCNGTVNKNSRSWDSMCNHPGYGDHPMHSHEYDRRTYGIPFRMYGDGVTSIACGEIWAHSVEALSWSSCLSPPIASWVTNILIIL